MINSITESRVEISEVYERKESDTEVKETEGLEEKVRCEVRKQQ